MPKLLAPQANLFLDHYQEFEKSRAGRGETAANRLRKAAIARFAELGWPGPRDEDWRFTSLAPLLAVPFALGTAAGLPPQRPASLPEGVIVCRLDEAIEAHPQLLFDHLARYADFKVHVFSALNTAFLRDGFFIYIPAGRAVEEAIYLPTTVAEGRAPLPQVWHRRCLVVLERDATATVVESFAGCGTYFTNAVTEIALADGAALHHYKLQRESRDAFHLHILQVQQGRGSRFASHSITFGGSWTRNEVNALLAGQAADCTLNGLYLGDAARHIDNRTFIDHAQPNCASHELYKGILTDRAHGVFNGKILVRPDAQKTDAKQTNQTLLLSDDAVINSKPQLEIYADDVKCTHGATVGQLDEDAVFYLRSRGISDADARSLLTFAFANDIVGRIQVEPVRRDLERLLLAGRGLPEL
jgi:Fe-S cluster assembly protein SufD